MPTAYDVNCMNCVFSHIIYKQDLWLLFCRRKNNHFHVSSLKFPTFSGQTIFTNVYMYIHVQLFMLSAYSSVILLIRILWASLK